MESFFKILILSIVGSFTLTAPHLKILSSTQPNALFRDSFELSLTKKRSYILAYVPALLILVLLSFLQAKSIFITFLFLGLLIGSSVFIATLSWLGAQILWKIRSVLPLELRISVLQIIRSPDSSLTMVLSLSLCMILINTVPSLNHSLDMELSYKEDRPSLFLFDIQDDQIEPLARDIEQMGHSLSYRSPMIRARLDLINGQQPFEKESEKGLQTREQEWADRMKNRTYNLSYRDQLFPSEKIIRGHDFMGRFDPEVQEYPAVSIEKRFAERLGLHIGDILTFNIQGVDLNAKIQSIRHVRWTSFQPNFFIQFQPGVLEDAVKIWLSGITSLTLSEKVEIQKAVVDRYPNISVLDVEAILGRVQGIIAQMITAMNFMSLLTVVVALLVLISIAIADFRRRKKDILILKAIGTQRAQILLSCLGEYFFIGLFAAGTGALCAESSAFILSHYVFESTYYTAILSSFRNGLLAVLVICMTSSMIVLTLLRQKTRELLNSNT